MEHQYKFLGALNGYDISFLNKNLIDILIENNVIIEENLIISDIKPDSCPTYLRNLNYFNDRYYTLNQKVLEEIFSILKIHIEIHADPNTYLDPIFWKLDSIIDRDKKVRFLKKYYKKIYPKAWQTYAMFIGEGDNGIETWKEWVYFNLGESPLLSIYLKLEQLELPVGKTEHDKTMYSIDVYHSLMSLAGKNKSILEEDGFYDLLDDWTEFYEKEYTLNLILQKIQELESSNIEALNPPLKQQSNIKCHPETLRELFINKQHYLEIIESLKKEDIVNEDLVVLRQEFPEFTVKRVIACIGWFLKKEGYLHRTTAINLCNALSNTFKESLSPAAYSAAKIDFEKQHLSRTHLSSQDYLDLLHFIRKPS